MHNHYVPQYYLKGFCDPSTPSILSRYEKGNRKPLTTSVKRLAQQRNLYPDDLENFLATQIEAPANPVLDKIKSQLPISVKDKEILARYMVTMLKRVPQGLERLRDATPAALEAIFSNLDSEIVRLMRENPDKVELLARQRDEAKKICANIDQNFPLDFWYRLVPPQTSPQVVGILSTMTWQFFTTEDHTRFMTSDNPVFFFDGLGIGQPKSEVTFPVTQNIVLWATWRIDLKDRCYVPTTSRIIREINNRTVSAATRYVFYMHEAKWVVKFVNKKDPILNRIEI